MSYTPTNWATGDVITAEKLNKMESGIGKAGSVYCVGVTVAQPEQEGEPTITLQKTFGEIKNALEYGSFVVVVGSSTQIVDNATVVSFTIPEGIQVNSGGGGTVIVNGPIDLIAQTDNDYPTNGDK